MNKIAFNAIVFGLILFTAIALAVSLPWTIATWARREILDGDASPMPAAAQSGEPEERGERHGRKFT